MTSGSFWDFLLSLPNSRNWYQPKGSDILWLGNLLRARQRLLADTARCVHMYTTNITRRLSPK